MAAIPDPSDLPALRGDMTMSEVLQHYPDAQRSLFARYHIGGCQSCAFSPTETLAQVCARNDDISVVEVIQHIRASHEGDAQLQITPQELLALRANTPDLKLLDVRTREEHEAVTIPGAVLMTQDLVQEAFSRWDKNTPLVLFDHTGSRSRDAVAYFIGHGFANAKCLAGGIDAYSREIDPSLPRYRIELEA